MAFGMIHEARIPDPNLGQGVWSLDFLGISYVPIYYMYICTMYIIVYMLYPTVLCHL